MFVNEEERKGEIHLMYKKLMIGVKKYSAFIVIACLLVFVSYQLVYTASFLPNGFDIEVTQNDRVNVKVLNLIGVEKEVKTITFSEKDIWKMDEIIYAIDRQKESLVLLFSFVSISGFLLLYKLIQRTKLWKAVLQSNIIFSVLFPLIPLISNVNRIKDLIY